MAKKTINIDIEINTKKAEEAVSKFGKFLGVEDTPATARLYRVVIYN